MAANWSGSWHKAINYYEWSHWCPLPTLEGEDELEAVTKERDALRFALIETSECLACWVGDSPHHEASQTVLARARKALKIQ